VRMDPVDRVWATPKAAGKTFYESFEAGDLPTMMQVWAGTSDICFIHPLGKALCGPAAVREGRGDFAFGQRLHIVLESVQCKARATGPSASC